ncbi:DUF937 domain-containing protein [Eremococcus coleocola]|uniref:DUF937 domain-containing protein n=1 Tax=Eremococcus coleocola ACS-139-V-Col8 TaxID=908337 RepID=E4KN24_9LACT|nr:DUF937 domain-containing protein [Eremococcus coleocola]EFR31607.1 hypothetical protein HMPREF9257_0001 [Eremococcus coleocola ACS-139-V-Col8]
MGLFDTVGSVIDVFNQGNGKDIDAIASKSGLSASQVTSVLAAAIPMILKAINRNNQTDEGLSKFDQALQDHAEDNSHDSLEAYVQNADEEDGDKMLGHVLQDKDSVITRLADAFGITPAAVKRVLVLVVPVLISYFAKEKKNKGLDSEQVRKQTQEAANDELVKKSQEGGLLGSVLGGLFGADNAPTHQQTADDSDDSILGSILDMFNQK